MIIMDFSKAFDKVPHRRLHYTLDWYGVRGEALDWIGDFLTDRTQRVVLPGGASSACPVLSGVPQGTVLGPILFLLYINDLPDDTLHSTVRLFADDCILHRPVRTVHDCDLLQQDLDSIAKWEAQWLMEFNVGKCLAMHVGRGRNKMEHKYMLHGQQLVELDSSKYLGITLTTDLRWNTHISNITKKANSALGLIRRNLRIASQTVKTQAYQALVRPHLEYASSVWDPYTQANIRKLEMVQRRAARYVCNRWHNTSSVSEMLNNLGWESLATRRRHARLCMMYKIMQGTAVVPFQQFLVEGYRGTRGSHTRKLQTISTSNDSYKYSFLPRTIVYWNALPPGVVVAPSLAAFQAGLTSTR